MPEFSKQSQGRLNNCHPDLRRLFEEVVKYYDCSILAGHRGQQEQDQLYREGKSQLRFPHSNHNAMPSRAVDVVPYPVDWKDTERFAHFAGYVQCLADQMGIAIRWGGDWDQDGFVADERFLDMPHFELI